MENSAVNAATAVSAILADPSKWRTLLDQFEEILRINIFIVDRNGGVVIPINSAENQQGGGLSGPSNRFGSALIASSFGIDLKKGGGAPADEERVGESFWEHFDARGPYMVATDPFDFRVYAVPVKKYDNAALFYLVAGPLRLGDFWPEEKYLALARSLGLVDGNVLKNIHSVGQVSEAALSAVLELLSEVVRDVYELSLEKQKFAQLEGRGDIVRPEIIAGVQDLLANIQHDELLISILDAAIKMAGAEGGSIMTLDEDNQDFVIRVSRGLENKKNIVQARIKMGEGIAGIAAQEKTPFFINGTEGDTRIKHLLKRPDIKQSFVVPILSGSDGQVMGVLNLYIKNFASPVSIPAVQNDIQKFSPLIAAALRSL